MLKISKIHFENPFVLAPLDGVNCKAFRYLCREQGASLVYSQMIHADGVVAAKDNFIKKYIDVIKKEKPIALQLVGQNPKTMGLAAEMIEEKVDIIDINFGCSMPHIVHQQEGGYFIKYPDKLEKIASSVISSINKPVTAKIRIGWNESNLNYLKIVNLLEDLGISAIAVHARTVEQGFSGKANWNIIKEIKEKTNVPILGNGDVFKPEDAISMIEQTSCDFVMIGRAAIGNPFIFKQCNDYYKKKEYKIATNKDCCKMFMKFLRYYKKYNESLNFPEIKQHAIWFAKGFENAKNLRKELIQSKTIEEIKKNYTEFNSQ